jgi:hypothetical protein
MMEAMIPLFGFQQRLAIARDPKGPPKTLAEKLLDQNANVPELLPIREAFARAR